MAGTLVMQRSFVIFSSLEVLACAGASCIAPLASGAQRYDVWPPEPVQSQQADTNSKIQLGKDAILLQIRDEERVIKQAARFPLCDPVKFGETCEKIAGASTDGVQNIHPSLVAIANQMEFNPVTAAALETIIDPFLLEMEEKLNESHASAQKKIDAVERAFLKCTSDWATAQVAATAPEAIAHTECRKSEAARKIAYDSCLSTQGQFASAKAVSCDLWAEKGDQKASKNHLPDPVDDEDHGEYLVRLQTFIAKELETRATRKAACESATSAHEAKVLECDGGDAADGLKQVWIDKQLECNSEQAKYESAVCTHTQGLEAECLMHSNCFEASMAEWSVDHQMLQTDEESRQTSWWMMERIKCFFEVFRKAGDDGHVDQEGVDACKNATHDVPHLNLTWLNDTLLSVPEACPQHSKPCSEAWVDATYHAIPSDAPLAACTPCTGEAAATTRTGHLLSSTTRYVRATMAFGNGHPILGEARFFDAQGENVQVSLANYQDQWSRGAWSACDMVDGSDGHGGQCWWEAGGVGQGHALDLATFDCAAAELPGGSTAQGESHRCECKDDKYKGHSCGGRRCQWFIFTLPEGHLIDHVKLIHGGCGYTPGLSYAEFTTCTSGDVSSCSDDVIASVSTDQSSKELVVSFSDN